LTADEGTFGQNETDLAAAQAALGVALNNVASGQSKLSDELGKLNPLTRTISTHRGGAFYNFYSRVTGSPPPKQLQASNPPYQLWRQGSPAAKLKGNVNHNHNPSRNNGSVAPSDHAPKPVKKGRPATGVTAQKRPQPKHPTRTRGH